MSSKLKPLAVKACIVAVSTVVALLVAEVALRGAGIEAIFPSHQELFVEHDPLLGWRKIPNATGMHRTSEYTEEESFNSKGLRGPEYVYAKPNQEYRVLVLGDSFAEGYSVSFDELVSQVLKRRLGGSHRPVEVINAGTGGYSTDQEVLFFSSEGRKYAPDLTVLLFYQNDVWYNGERRYWRGFKPRFELGEDSELSLGGVPVPLPESSKEDPIDKMPADSRGQTIKRWLRTRSNLYRLIRARVDASPTITALAAEAGLVDGRNGEPRADKTIPNEFRIFQTPMSRRFRQRWQLTEALLLKLRDDARSAGSRLLILYVPFRASIYDGEWEEMENQYGMTGESWSPERPAIILDEICARNALDCINPTDRFRRSSDRLYFVQDGHWNVAGHRLAGEILADAVAARFLAP